MLAVIGDSPARTAFPGNADLQAGEDEKEEGEGEGGRGGREAETDTADFHGALLIGAREDELAFDNRINEKFEGNAGELSIRGR